MPRLDFPKVLHPVNLSDYLPAFGAQVVSVWVNPPVATLRHIIEVLQADNPDNAAIFAALADLWDGWTAEEIGELFEQSASREPDLWSWLIESTFAAVNDYRDERKKAFRVRLPSSQTE
jgi:hypothetical protein